MGRPMKATNQLAVNRRITIALPKRLFDRVLARAVKERRSFGGQIAKLVEKGLGR